MEATSLSSAYGSSGNTNKTKNYGVVGDGESSQTVTKLQQTTPRPFVPLEKERQWDDDEDDEMMVHTHGEYFLA